MVITFYREGKLNGVSVIEPVQMQFGCKTSFVTEGVKAGFIHLKVYMELWRFRVSIMTVSCLWLQ